MKRRALTCACYGSIVFRVSVGAFFVEGDVVASFIFSLDCSRPPG